MLDKKAKIFSNSIDIIDPELDELFNNNENKPNSKSDNF